MNGFPMIDIKLSKMVTPIFVIQPKICEIMLTTLVSSNKIRVQEHSWSVHVTSFIQEVTCPQQKPYY